MAEPEREEQTNYTQADASGKSVAQDMFQSQTQQLPPQQQQQQQSQSQSQAQQATGPLLPPIQQTSGQPAQPAQPVPGHDQSQGSMQASSPQQAYAMHQQQQQQQQQHQQQQQQQQQHHPPPQQQPQYAHAQPPAPPQQQQSQPPPPPGHAQSPIVTPQQQYAQSPQQHYEQPPPQHYEQPPPQAHYAQPAPTQQQQPPQVQYELPPPPQANGAPPGYAPAQQHIPPHHSAYQYQQQQQQQQQPPPPQQPQYQPPLVNGDANAYPPQMRYPMPLPAGQMNAQQLSGTRHKKEIKRRTKTGCLTCRKRRIKCDEGHPSCRNCQKSKRECLGYDPIFKAQTGQPANIQPQPGSVPPPPASHSPHLPPPPAHAHAQYSNVPQGYAPASSAGYAPASVIQNQLEQAAYEYGGAIDPALAAAHPPPSHAPPPMPPAQEEYTTILLPERKVRLIAMDDVFSLDAIQPTFPAPRDPNSPMPQQDIDPIRDLYLREYAPGLDRFFETDWYSAAGLHILLASPDLLHYFAHCLHRFHIPPSESNKGLPSIEARLVWLLASMAFSPQASANNAPPLPFIPRIEAVSHLILGTFMQPESVPPAPAHMPDMKTQPEAYAFYLQDLFWHHLASLATVHDDVASPAAANDIASHLAGMRNILSMLENRDVLYSMAIARHFGGRMERFEPDKLLVGRGGEAEDPINKLAVAMSFLANEEVGGTTQVVQRVCGMGRRGFALQRLDFGMPSQNELKNEDYHDSVDCSDMSFEQHQSQHQHHQQEQPQHHVQPHENGNGEAKFEPAAAQQI